MTGINEKTLPKTKTQSGPGWLDDEGNRYVRLEVVARNGVPTAATSGSMITLLADTLGQAVIKGFDFGSNAIGCLNVAPPDLMTAEFTLLNAVTASGAGSWVNVDQFNQMTFYYSSTASGTTSTLQVECSPDQTQVAILDIETVTTSNVDHFSCMEKHKYVRGNLVADGGGSHTIKLIAGR